MVAASDPGPSSYSSTELDWAFGAACAGRDPALFFPVSTGASLHADIRLAKRVCDVCPVRPSCLRWAVENSITEGIWGGLTGPERHSRRQSARRGPRPRWSL